MWKVIYNKITKTFKGQGVLKTTNGGKENYEEKVSERFTCFYNGGGYGSGLRQLFFEHRYSNNRGSNRGDDGGGS